ITAAAGCCLGLAVPVTWSTRTTIGALISHGRVRRAWPGVLVAPVPLPPPVPQRLGQPNGLRVVEVVPGSPAASAGIHLEDIIVSAGRQPVQSVQALQRLMLGAGAIGRDLPVTVLRRNAFVDVITTLAEM